MKRHRGSTRGSKKEPKRTRQSEEEGEDAQGEEEGEEAEGEQQIVKQRERDRVGKTHQGSQREERQTSKE